MVARGPNFIPVELDIVGGSEFGRYAKISTTYTQNMFISDQFLVSYAGYSIAVNSSRLAFQSEGRGIFSSTKLGKIITVIGNKVFTVNIVYSQQYDEVLYNEPTPIGEILTSTGVVYIAENNESQILISDNVNLYIYDTTLSSVVLQVPNLDFTPGYITFHDSYFIAATGTSDWRLSVSNQGYQVPASGSNPASSAWPDIASKQGRLNTKPDNTVAVVRFPSKGNMIFVMGSTVTEAWFDTGAQIFPYQRNNQFNIDYGCIQAATVAYMDEAVVWLAKNEQSGPIIMCSTGGLPEKLSTDGIDYLFSKLTNPADSRAFLFRQDGHLFYHINFYTDNYSLFYDFTSKKFFNATDQNLNYFIASQVAFFKNQYYFVSKNTGNIYALDTTITYYEDTEPNGTVKIYTIPRSRTCKNIRASSQDYKIINDVGFTIESGEADYTLPIEPSVSESAWLATQIGNDLITESGNQLITQQGYNIGPDFIYFISDTDSFLITESGDDLIAEQGSNAGATYLSLPTVSISLSIDGGATFGSEWTQYLPPVAHRKNKLIWWGLGAANDAVIQIKFNSLARVVCSNGEVNLR